ncbi:MAG: hypothetical protein KGH72_03385 [Candidatus Micrarchaeota archaeon]|nr:hypothetical protein [Candidatus Micrarchaeota archaeon]
MSRRIFDIDRKRKVAVEGVRVDSVDLVDAAQEALRRNGREDSNRLDMLVIVRAGAAENGGVLYSFGGVQLSNGGYSFHIDTGGESGRHFFARSGPDGVTLNVGERVSFAPHNGQGSYETSEITEIFRLTGAMHGGQDMTVRALMAKAHRRFSRTRTVTTLMAELGSQSANDDPRLVSPNGTTHSSLNDMPAVGLGPWQHNLYRPGHPE